MTMTMVILKEFQHRFLVGNFKLNKTIVVKHFKNCIY